MSTQAEVLERLIESGEQARTALEGLPKTANGTKYALEAKASVATLMLACDLIEASGVVEQFEGWLQQERKSNAGRKAMVPVKAFLVAQLALTISNRATTYSRVHDELVREMDRSLRRRLGFPVADKIRDAKGSKQAWKRRDAHLDRQRRLMGTSPVYRRGKALAAVVDPKVYPVKRGLLPAEVKVIDAARDEAEVVEKQRRADQLPAQLLAATFHILPAEVRARWRGDVTLDGTTVRAGNKFGHRAFGRSRKGAMSPEVNAGVHTKAPDSRDRTLIKKADEAVFGYELHLAGAVVDGHETESGTFPKILVGMSVDRPGTDPGQNAVTVVKHIAAAGLPVGALIVDRGYSQMAAEDFHLPIKALGYEGVWDYKSTDYGVQATLHGLLVVEGNLYGPCIPQHLIDATRDHKSGKLTEEEYAELIEQRRAYRARVKTESDGRTSATFRCPGAGDGRTVRCDLKPVSARQENLEIEQRKTLPLVFETPVDPPKCCTNKESVSIPPDFAAKWLQREHYGSPEWQRYYAFPRNTIERLNRSMKQGDKTDANNPDMRRYRGYGKQLIAFVMQAVATNVDIIREFLEKRVDADNQETPKTSGRTGRPPAAGLQRYEPDVAVPDRLVGAGKQIRTTG